MEVMTQQAKRSASSKENEPSPLAKTKGTSTIENVHGFSTPSDTPSVGNRVLLTKEIDEVVNVHKGEESLRSPSASPSGRLKGSPADSLRSTPASASKIPKPRGFVSKIPSPPAKEKKLVIELDAARMEKERLVQENTSLQSALQEAQEAIQQLRSEEAQLRSRASVAEESRTATSKVLLSLTEQASRLHAERADLHERLQERDQEVEDALAQNKNLSINDMAMQQEANNEVFILTERLVAAEEALAAREAQLTAAQEATCLLAGREQELVHQLQLASFAVQQEVEEKDRVIRQLQADTQALASQLEAAKADHREELSHALSQLQDNEAQLLGRVSLLSKQNAALQEQVTSRDKDLAALQQQMVGKEEELNGAVAALQQVRAEAKAAAVEAEGKLLGAKDAHSKELAALRQQLKDAREAQSKAKALAQAVEASNKEVGELRRMMNNAQARAGQLEALLEVAEEARVSQVATLRAEVSAAELAGQHGAAELAAQLAAAEQRHQAEVAALAAERDAAAGMAHDLGRQLEEAVAARDADVAFARAQALEGDRAIAALREEGQQCEARSAAELAALREQLAAAWAAGEERSRAAQEALELTATAKDAELAAARAELAAAAAAGTRERTAELDKACAELASAQQAQEQLREQLALAAAAQGAELAAARAELEREREAVVRLQSREAVLLAEAAELRQAAHSSEQQVLHLQRELQAIQDEIGDMQNAAASLLQQDSAWLEEASRRVTVEEEEWRHREAQQTPSASNQTSPHSWAAEEVQQRTRARRTASPSPLRRTASPSPLGRPSLATTVEALTRQLEDAAGQVERLGRERDAAAAERHVLEQDLAVLVADKEALAALLASAQGELQGSTAREAQLQRRVVELEAAAAGSAAARPAPGKLRLPLPPLPPTGTGLAQPSPRMPCRVTLGAAAASPRLGSSIGGVGGGSPFTLGTAPAVGARSGVPKLLLAAAVGGGSKVGCPAARSGPAAAAAAPARRRPSVQQGRGKGAAPAPLMVVAGKWVAGLGLAALGLAGCVQAVHFQRQRQRHQLGAARRGGQEKLPPVVPLPKTVPSKMARLPGKGRKAGGRGQAEHL